MQATKKTIKEWLSEFFGTNVTKAVSENLTTEDYNLFESSGAKIQEQLSELDDLKTKYKELDGKVKAEEQKSADLTSKLTTANSELLKFKNLYEKDKNQGKELPLEDASNLDEGVKTLKARIESLPEGHPDRVGLEAFLEKQPIK